MKISTNYKSKKYYVGRKFINSSNLIVKIVGKDLKDKRSKFYFCEFEDGSISRIASDNLTNGKFKYPITFSQGNNQSNRYKTIYKRYEFILQRCNNPKAKDFERYGGRGIRCEFNNVYELWFSIKNDSKIELLLDEPFNYELDRINNNSNYKPGNIRIVTRSENQRNKNNNFVYNLIDNLTEKLLFIGIKTDCETWIKNNLGVKTSLDMTNIKKEVGKKNGYSVRYEIADAN